MRSTVLRFCKPKQIDHSEENSVFCRRKNMFLYRLDQRFLTFFGLFPTIDFYYDRIPHPTILVNVNMRHFMDSQWILKD